MELQLFYFIDYKGGTLFSPSLLPLITISKSEIIRQKIYVKLTKLLNNNYKVGEFLAFETNITDIENIKSDIFNIATVDKFNYKVCILRKTEELPLLLLCQLFEEGKHSFGNISQEIDLEDIHTKYEFTILPQDYIVDFEVKNSGGYILLNYPLELNFNLHYSYNNVEFLMMRNKEEAGIKLNKDSVKYLECKDIGGFIKSCIVPKSHFQRKADGYYYASHIDNIGEDSIFYLSSPFKVTFPIENELILEINNNYNSYERVIGIDGTISFVLDYKDKLNQFNTTEIEVKSKFKTIITDENSNIYKVNFRIWKPTNDNLRLFCKLDGSLIKNEINYINLIGTTFVYNDEFNFTMKFNMKKVEVQKVQLFKLNQKVPKVQITIEKKI